MKKLAVIFLFVFSCSIYGQEVVSTGIKRTIKTIENDDLPQIITVKKLVSNKKQLVKKDSSKVKTSLKKSINTVLISEKQKNKHHSSIKRIVN